MIFMRKYATASQIIQGIPLVTKNSMAFKASPTLASGDVKVSRDGGAFANIETEAGAGAFADYIVVTPAASRSVRITLNAALTTCKTLVIQFVDAAGAEWEDQQINVETFGHASAQHVGIDWTDTVRQGMTALPAAVPGAAGGVFIAGTNAETTITTALNTTFTGNLTGNVNGTVILNNGVHGGASTVVTLMTPIVANTTLIEGVDATNQLAAVLGGAGSNTVTLTIQDDDSNDLEGVDVWVTAAADGSGTLWGTLATDADGEVQFMLDDGTYYVWCQHKSWNFTNPATLTVDETPEALTVAAASASTTGTYQAPGMTRAQVVAALERMTGLDVDDADDLLRMHQAVTAAGQAASTWQGKGWWWSLGKSSFTTQTDSITSVARASNVATITAAAHGLIAGERIMITGVTTANFDTLDATVVSAATDTFTYANAGSNVTTTADATGTVYSMGYPLRTVNSSAMQDMWVPKRVWVADDYKLKKVMSQDWEDWVVTDMGVGQPSAYALTGDLNLLLQPIPNEEYLITVQYIKRHGTVNSTSGDGSLMVPAEFHWSVYVSAAAWLIRHDIADGASLASCPEFVETMNRMAAADPSERYDDDGDSSDTERYPADTHVFISKKGLSI